MSFFITSSYYKEEIPKVYSGSGIHWEVTIEFNDKEDRFLTTFTYKRDLEELQQLDMLQFFLGTRLNTAGATYFRDFY